MSPRGSRRYGARPESRAAGDPPRRGGTRGSGLELIGDQAHEPWMPRFYAALTEKQLRRGVHRSSSKLETAIRRYVEITKGHPSRSCV